MKPLWQEYIKYIENNDSISCGAILVGAVNVIKKSIWIYNSNGKVYIFTPIDNFDKNQIIYICYDGTYYKPLERILTKPNIIKMISNKLY